MEIKKVGVVGCGVMGNGIVLNAAQQGFDVVVSEMNDDLLKKGLATVDKLLSRSVEKEKITQADKDATIARIKGTTDVKDFGDCDVVVESATENMEIKKQLFTALDKACKPGAIIGSNTSCLSIMDLAMQTSRPESVCGLHFFNPVPIMKLLEIIRTLATSDATVEAMKKWGAAMGKETITAVDTPGFIVTRSVIVLVLEAIRMLEANSVTKEDIDTGVRLGLNHAMGPIQTADLIGLDTIYNIASAMYDEFKQPHYSPPVLLRKMVVAGWLGRKTGKGFYDYA